MKVISIHKNEVKRMMSKKGQGLSLNVIIIAVLALIVLVVLVAIFTGRITLFQRDVDKQSQTELISLRISYGECHPGTSEEGTFNSELASATSSEEKESARARFREKISSCKSLTSQAPCASAGCSWG